MYTFSSLDGKTELAEELALLLNKPNEKAFHKVDCGKLRDADELFGMSGPYQGSNEGSSLNNFIVRMSQSNKIGVVLLDEIDKARSNVHSGLYQVLDKGEWTNKKLERGSSDQTTIVNCRNIVFIMTTNLADSLIEDYSKDNLQLYTESFEKMEGRADELQDLMSNHLSNFFSNAFLGRISCLIPFFPLSNGDRDRDKTISCEVNCITRFLIERKMEDLHTFTGIEAEKNEMTEEKISKIIAKRFQSECGVRSIQKLVDHYVGRKVHHVGLLEQKYGGVAFNSTVSFQAKVEDLKVSIRQVWTNEKVADDSDDVETAHEGFEKLEVE